ncbi:response regulator [Mesorhizobium sp. ASY16-5R]|uniref:response regulator n=1 Tax=Mesorhizobium sp. ASY16-5R TaxID=3445772 RepID=UPI003FA0BC41
MTTKPIVLVVEDEIPIRMDIVDQLEERWFTVFEAGIADEAIDIVIAYPKIGLLFTDIDMPGGMDGLKLANAVRDRWPPIKIILESVYRSVAESDMPAESRLFSKPYDADAVAKTMCQMMAPP